MYIILGLTESILIYELVLCRFLPCNDLRTKPRNEDLLSFFVSLCIMAIEEKRKRKRMLKAVLNGYRLNPQGFCYVYPLIRTNTNSLSFHFTRETNELFSTNNQKKTKRNKNHSHSAV